MVNYNFSLWGDSKSKMCFGVATLQGLFKGSHKDERFLLFLLSTGFLPFIQIGQLGVGNGKREVGKREKCFCDWALYLTG